MKVEYTSINSGGDWWLDDDDWRNLEAAGWKVNWVKDDPLYRTDKDGRWIGALATRASREGLSLEDAIAEFESITSSNAEDEGCSCCGRPHSFTEYDNDGKYIRS